MKVLDAKFKYKISRNREYNQDKIKWYDIYNTEQELIFDMLRLVSNPDLLYQYEMPRGYEYLNSFKKYYCSYKCLTNKQLWVLKNRMFLEIVYWLYVKGYNHDSEDEYGSWKVLSRCFNKRIQEIFPSNLCNKFIIYSPTNADIYVVELYNQGNKVELELKRDFSRFIEKLDESIEKQLLFYAVSLVKYAVTVVGEVDCIIVERDISLLGRDEICMGDVLPQDIKINNTLCLRILHGDGEFLN